MKGIFYQKKMISSKLFTTLLKYNVNDKNYYSTYKKLVAKIKEIFESNKFTYTFSIVSADYTYKSDTTNKPYVEIVVMVYATIDSQIESNKTFKKLFAEFIDDNCAEFDDIDVNLISRDIAV